MENNKKIVNYILFFLIFVLIFLLIFINWLTKKPFSNKERVTNAFPTMTINQSNSSLKTKLIEKNSSAPTIALPTIEVNFTGVQEVEIPKEIINQTHQELELKKESPYLIDSFFIEYDYGNDHFVVYPKNKNAPLNEENLNRIKEKIKNNFPQIPEERFKYSPNPPPPLPKKEAKIEPTLIVSLTPYLSPTEFHNPFSSLVEILRILYGMGNFSSDISKLPNENPVISPFLTPTSFQNYQPSISITDQTRYKNFVYFSQCDSRYGNYSLPGGCTICQAGCGPTTVAMIISSYKNRVFSPLDSVNQYGRKVGCIGSSYLDAISILIQNGVKVGSIFLATDYYAGKKATEIADEFRKYILAGKTIFTLANFRSDGGGHFFWVIDVDTQGNIWAFDPYYGRYQIPYNENSRYPYPLYRVAFPVSP